MSEPLGFTEPAITKSVANISGRDPRFAVALARALLSAAAGQGDAQLSARAKDLLREMPATGLKLHHGYPFRHDGLIDILRDWPVRSIVDWVFESPPFALLVEAKTRPETGFQWRQLRRYHVALAGRKSVGLWPHSGLLALAPYELRDDEALTARSKRYLGSVSWQDAAEGLRSVTPSDSADASCWSEILDHLHVGPAPAMPA